MKKRIVELTLCALLFLGLSSSSFVYAVMPLPSGTNIYSYLPTALPAVNTDPSQAQPIGVGNVTFTHDLTLQIGLDSFSEPVDIYVALYAPAVFSDMFLFRSDGNLTPLSLEFSPWKAATSGPVNEVLLGTIPLSLIPSGDYTFYLIAAPTGTKAESLADNCYIWGTSVGNLRVLDVSKKAASLFGGDVEGAAAILMALGRNHDIENVAKALLSGRLTQYGSILANAAVISMSLFEDNLPSFCEQGASVDGCRQDLLISLGELHAQLEATELNKDFEKLVSAYTTYLASLGYTAEQIHEAIIGTMLAGDTFIHPFKYEFYIGGPILPFGGIFEYTEADDGGQILKYVTPKGSPASFSDLPQALSLNKSTLSLDSGDSETVTISGGSGYYTVNTSNSQVATAVISGSNLEITGLSSGSATITVSDTGGETATISVTVSSASVVSGDCGAYVAPGVWKDFDCYNLAAIGKTTNDDPFTPSWRLIGGYWQWGRKGPDSSQWYDTNTEHFVHGPTGPGSGDANKEAISEWDQISASDGAWSDSFKTANDPCPDGFRVPTQSQWVGVRNNNTQSMVGSWNEDDTNYSAARFFGSALMLQNAGYRDYLLRGAFGHRVNGRYWSTSEEGSSRAWCLYFSSWGTNTSRTYRMNGLSIRCISE